VLQILDASFEDTAHEAFLCGVFDLKLFDASILDHRHAGFELFDVDDDLALGRTFFKPYEQ